MPISTSILAVALPAQVPISATSAIGIEASLAQVVTEMRDLWICLLQRQQNDHCYPTRGRDFPSDNRQDVWDTTSYLRGNDR
jgi:hypothetical protein